MPASIPLGNAFDAVTLRRLARRSKDARQSRRLLALAAVYDAMIATGSGSACWRDGQAKFARLGSSFQRAWPGWPVQHGPAGPRCVAE